MEFKDTRCYFDEDAFCIFLFSAYSTCNSPNVTCGSNDDTRCITPQQMCDGSSDCSDGSDEKGCQQGTICCQM